MKLFGILGQSEEEARQMDAAKERLGTLPAMLEELASHHQQMANQHEALDLRYTTRVAYKLGQDGLQIKVLNDVTSTIEGRGIAWVSTGLAPAKEDTPFHTGRTGWLSRLIWKLPEWRNSQPDLDGFAKAMILSMPQVRHPSDHDGPFVEAKYDGFADIVRKYGYGHVLDGMTIEQPKTESSAPIMG